MPAGLAALCPMHNAEVLIIMVMRGEIWSMQMQGFIVAVSLDMDIESLDLEAKWSHYAEIKVSFKLIIFQSLSLLPIY